MDIMNAIATHFATDDVLKELPQLATAEHLEILGDQGAGTRVRVTHLGTGLDTELEVDKDTGEITKGLDVVSGHFARVDIPDPKNH